MRIAIISFDGFNEIDTFLPLGLLNRLSALGWKAEIAAPGHQITSMNGVTVQAQQPLEFANEADAVIFGSGIYTRAIAENSALLDRLQLDPLRQLIGAQCSGTLLLARLGLLGDAPACTDLTTKPWVVEAGVRVVDAALPRPRSGRHRRRLPGGAVPVGLDDGAGRGRRGRGPGAALRRAGGPEGGLRPATARRGPALHQYRADGLKSDSAHRPGGRRAGRFSALPPARPCPWHRCSGRRSAGCANPLPRRRGRPHRGSG